MTQMSKFAIKLSVKTFKTRTVHFVFSLRIFVSVHVIITSITAPGMFIKLCLVVLLLLPGSLVSKFHHVSGRKRETALECGAHNKAFLVTFVSSIFIFYIPTNGAAPLSAYFFSFVLHEINHHLY